MQHCGVNLAVEAVLGLGGGFSRNIPLNMVLEGCIFSAFQVDCVV